MKMEQNSTWLIAVDHTAINGLGCHKESLRPLERVTTAQLQHSHNIFLIYHILTVEYTKYNVKKKPSEMRAIGL